MLSLEEGRLRVLGRGWGWQLCPPGEGQASHTAPPVTGGETEAQRPFAHCWGPRVCRGPSRLPRTPADPGKACAQTPRCPSPHRGASWPRVPGGMCVCTAVDSEGWSRGLAVEALLPQSHLRHVSTQPQVGMGAPARPPWSGSKECGSRQGRGQVGMVPIYPSLWGSIAWS